jgi:hypothetical protein
MNKYISLLIVLGLLRPLSEMELLKIGLLMQSMSLEVGSLYSPAVTVL